MKKILIFSIIILAGIGCKKAVNDAGLLKAEWILSYIQDTRTNAITDYPADAAREISIVFTDSLNTLAFSGVCNGGSGTYSLSSNDNIKITNLGTTLIGCKYDEWEEYTTQNLDAASKYEIAGNTLVIYSKGTYNLYFTKN